MKKQEKNFQDNVLSAINTPCNSEMVLDSYEQIQDDYVHIQDLYDNALDRWAIAVKKGNHFNNRNWKLTERVSNCFMLKIKPAYDRVTKYRYFDGNMRSTVTNQYRNQFLNYQKASKEFYDVMPEFDVAYDKFYRNLMGQETIFIRIGYLFNSHRKR